ncbi:hypothetical protein H4I96_00145 [Botrytis cinerea]
MANTNAADLFYRSQVPPTAAQNPGSKIFASMFDKYMVAPSSKDDSAYLVFPVSYTAKLRDDEGEEIDGSLEDSEDCSGIQWLRACMNTCEAIILNYLNSRAVIAMATFCQNPPLAPNLRTTLPSHLRYQPPLPRDHLPLGIQHTLRSAVPPLARRRAPRVLFRDALAGA